MNARAVYSAAAAAGNVAASTDADIGVVVAAIADSMDPIATRLRYILTLAHQRGIVLTREVVVEFFTWLTARDAVRRRMAGAAEPHLTADQLNHVGWGKFSEDEMRIMAAIAAQS